MTTVRDAAAGIVGQAAMPAGGIGAPLRRHEGRAKVTGAAKYAGEELPPNTLHAAIVASSIASGRVTSIDVARARTVAGVVRVLTHDDMPKLGPAPIPPAGQSFTPMQDAEIRYEGQPIALVLAETLEAAEEGAAAVEATYRRDEPVVFESGEERSPRRENNGYALWEFDTRKGDAEKAFATAAATVDQTYVTPTRHHNAMEPSTTLAEWRDGALYIHDATQWTYGVRYALAGLLKIPPETIHVRCPYTGGAFGAKGIPGRTRFLPRWPRGSSHDRSSCR